MTKFGFSVVLALTLGAAAPPEPSARAVAFILAGAQPSVQALAASLGSPDSRERIKAAMALSEAGPSAKDALPALTKALADRNLNVRYFAGSALRGLGPAAASAVPALMAMLKTFPGAVPELEGPPRYFADTRSVAAEALGAIGPAAKAARPALAEALKDPSPDVREAAAEALKKVGG